MEEGRPQKYCGDEKVWLPGKGWTQTRYMPRLAGYRGRLAAIPFDFHELIGALAPRHALIIAPLKDHNFRADSVDRIAAAARPVFALHGRPERLRVVHPDEIHIFRKEDPARGRTGIAVHGQSISVLKVLHRLLCLGAQCSGERARIVAQRLQHHLDRFVLPGIADALDF